MRRILALIHAVMLGFLRPRVDGDAGADAGAGGADVGADAGNAGADAGAAAAADDQGDLFDQDADGAGDDAGGSDADAATLRREAEEARARAARAERELEETRRRPAPADARPDPQYEEEERVLKDPNADENAKWRIQANRAMRANTSTANAALVQAMDVSDKTAFTALSISNPVAKKYEARVEARLTEMRKVGQNARREDVFKYLLGEDMVSGKFKKRSAPAGGARVTPQDRAAAPRSAGVRSDVRASGNQSERDKRRARLENVQI